LTDLLESGREHALTLICAPAGYGKTALLAEWRDRSADSRRFAWLTLDRDDSDPIRLWSHLLTAIADAAPELDRQAPLRELALDNLTDGFLPLLLETLADLPGERLIVLDDYDLVDDVVCDESLQFFVQHQPANVRLVVASRSTPRLPLGRLRAHGDLLEIGPQQLRFGPDDTACFTGVALGRPLAREDVATLVERCEGWPAGIHLASLLLAHSEDPHTLIASFDGDNRYVFDYLQHDLLARLSDETRTFLRRTSILSRLSAELCDRVMESDDSHRILRELERANLFLVPLDDRRDWFRYHHLFGGVLRRELADIEPELIPALHARASHWLNHNGQPEDAIAHAIVARDTQRASELITSNARRLLSTGRVAVLEGWLRQLDWDEAIADPQLAIVRAFVLCNGHAARDAVVGWLRIAAHGQRETPLANGMPSLEFGVGMVRALFVLGDVAGATEAGRWVLARAPKTSEWRLEALFGHGQTLYLNGCAAAARAVLEQAVIEGRADATNIKASALAFLALIELDSGDVNRGEALAAQSLAILADQGIPAPGVTHLALGVALAANGALAEAEAEIEQGAKSRQLASPTVGHAHALVLLARARLARGDLTAARETVEAARLEAESMLDAGMVSALLADTDRRVNAGARRPVTAGEDLSEREQVVLRLLAAGLTKPEIARELYIAYNTVKTHTRTIYRKLDASTRAEAVTRARDLSLL
jgi:LuxR family maltose regulon positive regulatory protein